MPAAERARTMSRTVSGETRCFVSAVAAGSGVGCMEMRQGRQEGVYRKNAFNFRGREKKEGTEKICNAEGTEVRAQRAQRRADKMPALPGSWRATCPWRDAGRAVRGGVRCACGAGLLRRRREYARIRWSRSQDRRWQNQRGDRHRGAGRWNRDSGGSVYRFRGAARNAIRWDADEVAGLRVGYRDKRIRPGGGCGQRR